MVVSSWKFQQGKGLIRTYSGYNIMQENNDHQRNSVANVPYIMFLPIHTVEFFLFQLEARWINRHLNTYFCYTSLLCWFRCQNMFLIIFAAVMKPKLQCHWWQNSKNASWKQTDFTINSQAYTRLLINICNIDFLAAHLQ